MLDPVLQLGPFMIPVEWLALLASFFIAIWLMRRDLNRAGLNGGQAADILWGALLTGLIVYRFGGVLLDPISLFRNPIQVLMGAPVSYMKWVGFGTGLVYVIWKLYRAGMNTPASWSIAVNAAGPSILLGIGVYQLFAADLGRATTLPWGVEAGNHLYHPLHLYRGIGFLLLGFLLRRQSVQREHRLGWALLGAGMVTMIVSFVSFSDVIWLGLTPGQWASLAASSAGLVSLWRKQS